MKSNSSKLWLLLLLGVTIVAIMLLSASLSGFELFPGESFPVWIFGFLSDEPQPERVSVAPPSLALNLAGILTFLFLLILTVWVIIFIIRPELRKYMLKRLISYLFFLSLIYILLSNIPRLNFLSEGEGDTASGLSDQAIQVEVPPPTPTLIADPPQWLVVGITLAFIAGLLAIVWWLWQRRPQPDYQGDTLAVLALQAQQTVKALNTGSDLKDTVMRCYRDMHQVLSEQRGIKRQQAMTPREFEKHLSEIGLRDKHIKRLTRLFESVRYGTNVSSERDKREAMDCLRAIARAYGRSA